MNQQPPRFRRSSPIPGRVLHVAYYFFLAAGVFALGYAGYVVAESRIYQQMAIKTFQRAGPLLEPHSPAEGEVVGEIELPRVGIHAIVLNGDSPAQLRHAVGHLSKSALPGERGNVVIAGHRDTFFRPLQNVLTGDEIRFTTRGQRFEYVVLSVEVVEPTDVRVLRSSTGHELTLLTCFPFRFVGPAPKRFVVHAREVEDGVFLPDAQPAPGIEAGVPK
jgi:sortase A